VNDVPSANPCRNGCVRTVCDASCPYDVGAGTDLQRVRELCAEVYTPEGVEIWMAARNQRFHGRTPMELIEAGDTGDVLMVLDQLASGAYA
jgi:hypothetical protein